MGDPVPTATGWERSIRLSDVTIRYRGGSAGRDVVAVTNMTVDIPGDERFVILGPSGCGKSTLLAAIAGFIPVHAGSISVGETVVKGPSIDRVMIFQESNQLLPWKTVNTNVEFGLKCRWPKMGREERRRRVNEAIEMVRLSPQADQYPHTLSGGQRQRVAIARSLAIQPSMLLMDEPFGALDAITRERMQRHLNDIWRRNRVTVVFVTHDVAEAVRVGDRILVMTPGPGRVKCIVDNRDVQSAFEASDEDQDPALVSARIAELHSSLERHGEERSQDPLGYHV